MIELERLYGCAEKYLGPDAQDWTGFSRQFRIIFDADFVLYKPTLADEVLAWRSLEDMVASTRPDLAQTYIEKKIFDSNHIADDSLNPFEPSLRTDFFSDDEFRGLKIAKEYFIPQGIFYLLAVSAILKDQSNLMLVVWRDEQGADFSEIEKQRLALFMRYLATLVPAQEMEVKTNTNSDISEFGEKYALTETEVSILSLLLQGRSLKMIATQSGRAYGTVRWHVQNILEKCQVKTQKNLLSEFYRLIKR